MVFNLIYFFKESSLLIYFFKESSVQDIVSDFSLIMWIGYTYLALEKSAKAGISKVG